MLSSLLHPHEQRPATSTSLIEHIYTNNPSAVVTTDVSDLSTSDHNPTNGTRSIKLLKPEPKGHTHSSFRSFKHFNQNAFFAGLICRPFDGVHQHMDPNEALAVWYKLFMDAVSRLATVRHKRVKHSKLPPWLNKNIIQAVSDRDRLKKERTFSENKTARNKVRNLVGNVQKLYLRKLVENNKDISSVWRALNTFTKGTHSRQKEIPHQFTADAFNDYFLSIAETLVKSQDSSDSNKHYSCSKRLVDFCQQTTKGTDSFTIPLIAVHEMRKNISGIINKKSSRPNEISNQLLKLAPPYIAGSLTYIFKLCMEQNVFPSEFQKAKVIPLPRTTDHKNLNDYRPVSLLSVLSKLLERHVHKHVVTCLETRDHFHPLLSGFLRKLLQYRTFAIDRLVAFSYK